MSTLFVLYDYKPYSTLVSVGGNVSLLFSQLIQTEKCQQQCELLLKFGTDIHGEQKVNPNNFKGTTFPPPPSSGQNFNVKMIRISLC